jgi:hypothetical protein
MGLLSYTQIEDGNEATANAFNIRFGDIIDVINGNIDQANIKNESITTAKLAPQSVTSDKLGFTKYTDANGWLIIDLGLVKLATKSRTFKTKAGGIQFVDFDPGMSTNPEGFNSSSPYNMVWSFWGTAGVGQYSFNVEASPRPQPNTAVVATAQGGSTSVVSYTMETWVVF